MTTLTLDQAHRDVEDAQRLVETLRERVRDGDPEIQATDIAEQEALAKFAELRLDAAQREAERAETEARHQTYADLGADVRRHLVQHDDVLLVAAYAEAVKAIARLYNVATARDTLLRELHRRVDVAYTEAVARGELEQMQGHGVVGPDGAGGILVGTKTDRRHLQRVAPALIALRPIAVHVEYERHDGGVDAEIADLPELTATVTRALPGIADVEGIR